MSDTEKRLTEKKLANDNRLAAQIAAKIAAEKAQAEEDER